MTRDRMTGFTDGVIAVIITIMVLDLRAPATTTAAGLLTLGPTFFSYVLSFVYVAIYWNNHHHMFQLVERVSGGILWANLHLLFWLSLIPFATSWLGAHPAAAIPSAVYGISLLMPAIAYFILQSNIIRYQGKNSPLAAAIGRDLKARLSPAAYVVGIILAFVATWAADVLYAAVALVWLIPDRRIESRLQPTRND